MNENVVGFELQASGGAQVTAELQRTAQGLAGMAPAAQQATQGVDQLNAALGRVGQYAARSLGIAALAAGATTAARSFIQSADAVTVLQNRLQLATGSAKAASQAYAALFDIAQQSRQSFTELGGTYATIATATQTLGISQGRLLTVTQAIGNAMAISGGSAESMRAALIQLGQGLSSGTLRGEELNSILEQTPRLARALADGLGVGVGELRKLGEQGAISAEAVVKALESQAEVLKGEVAGSVLTVAQAFTQLGNAAVKRVGDLDKITGASALAAKTISDLAKASENFGGSLQKHEGVIKAFGGAVVGIAGTAVALGLAAGAIKGVAAAVGLVGVALAANPLAAALLGLTVAVGVTGAIVGGNSPSLNTQAGLRERIAQLEAENKQAPSIYARGPEDIAKHRAAVEERKRLIADLRASLSVLQTPELDTRAEDARLQRGTEALQARKKAETDLYEIRRQLYGLDKDYLPTLNKLYERYTNKDIELPEYQRLVGDLARKNYKAPEKTAKATGPDPDADYKRLAAQIREVVAAQDIELSQGEKLSTSQKLRLDIARQLATGQLTLNQAQEQTIESLVHLVEENDNIARIEAARKKADEDEAKRWEQRAALIVRNTEAAQRELDARYQTVGGIVEGNLQLQQEIAAIGLSQAARTGLVLAVEREHIARLDLDLITARNIEGNDAQVAAIEREIAARRRRLQLLGDKADAEAADESAKQALSAWQRTSDSINQSLTDALLRGFESGKGFAQNLRDTVVNMFRTMVLRPVVSAIVQPAAGALTNALGFTGGGSPLGQGASLINAGTSAYGAVSNTANLLGFGPGSSIYSQFATSNIGNALGLSTTVDAIGGLGTAANALSGAGSAFTAAMPYLTVAIAVLSMLAKSGETRQGAGYQVNDGRAVLGGGPSGGAINQALETKLVQSTFDTINATLKSLGSSITVASFQAGLEQSTKGKGATFAGGTLSSGASFGQTYDPALYTQTLTAEQAASQFGDKLARAQLLALQAAADTLPGYVQRALASLDIPSLDAASATQALASLQALPDTLAALGGISADAIKGTFLQALQTGDYTQAGQAVGNQVVGSIQQAMLGFGASQIYDVVNKSLIAPFIEAIVTGQNVLDVINQGTIDAAVNKALAAASSVGAILADPRIKEALDKLKTGIAAAYGQGGAALGSAQFISPTIADANVGGTGTTAGASTVKDVAAERRALQDRLDAATLTRIELLDKERTGLDATNRELFDTVIAKEQAREADDERKRLLEELNALTDTNAQALARQRDAVKESNLALFDQLAAARQLASQRQALLGLVDSVVSSVDRFLPTAQARAFQIEVLARKFVEAGAGGSVSSYIQTFTSLDDAGIKAFVQQFLLLPDATIAAKQAVLELGNSLLDLSALRETNARATFDQSVAAERKLLQARTTAARETIAQAEAIFNAARSAQRDLLGQGSTGAYATEQARAFLDSSLAAIRTSGYLPDPAQLSDAISQSVRGLGDAVYTTQAEADFARIALAGTLGELGNASGLQLDTAKAQLKAAEDAAKSLDQLVDQFSGLNAALVPLPDAIRELVAAMAQRGTLGDIARNPALLPYIQPVAPPADLLSALTGPSTPGPRLSDLTANVPVPAYDTAITTPGPLFPSLPLNVPMPAYDPSISTPGPTFPAVVAELQSEMAGMRDVLAQMVDLQKVAASASARTADHTAVLARGPLLTEDA